MASINSLISLRYPEFQVVVVSDGSTDATLERLIKAFKLQPSQRVVRHLLPTKEVHGIYESAYVPNLVVVDKANGGKADALNCGINLARYPLVCCMDGDSLLENDALLRIARPFMDRPDMVASGGVVRPLNGCKVTPMGIRGIFLPGSWLARFQIVEYLRAFLFARVGLASLDSMFIVSGAFGVFRKDVVVAAGGFETATIGEDFELVVRLHRCLREWKRPHHITLVPDPGVLDRGARGLPRAGPPAEPLAAWPAGDPLAAPEHVLQPEVRPHRALLHALLPLLRGPGARHRGQRLPAVRLVRSGPTRSTAPSPSCSST